MPTTDNNASNANSAEEHAPQNVGRARKVRRWTGNLIATLWLLIICLGAVSFALICFSAFGVQQEIRQYQHTDGTATLGHVISLAVQWRSYEAQITAQSDKLRLIDDQISSSESQAHQLNDQLNEAKQSFIQLTEVLHGIAVKKVMTLDAFSDQNQDLFVLPAVTWRDKAMQLFTEGKLLNEATGEGGHIVLGFKIFADHTVKDLFDNINLGISSADRLNNHIRRIGIEQALLRNSRISLNNELNRIAAKEESDPELNKPTLKNLYYQIIFFGRIPAGNLFATMPEALLVPLLALIMGALGSAIFLSLQMIARSDEVTPLQLIFRPVIGMLLAFAVFILAHGGMLVASQNGGDGGTGQLNPYFISFIGIVSGLVSESAARRIKEAAESFFQAPKEEIVTIDNHEQSPQ